MTAARAASLDDILVYVRVVELRSISRAARSLGLPKSTVSRRLARLEERLGVKLLHRTSRAVTVTTLGAEYFTRCARVVAAADEANEAIEAAREGPRGLVRLTTPVVFGTGVLPDVLIEFLAAHPEVEIEAILTDQQVDLVAERFDLAVRVGSKLPDSTLEARVLAPATTVLVASPAYLARAGRPKSPADLAGHEMLLLGPGAGPRRMVFERGARSVEVEIAGRVRTNDLFLARALMVAGFGIAMLPEFLLRGLGEPVQTVLDGWQVGPTKLFTLHPPAPTAAARALVERLVAAMRDRST